MFSFSPLRTASHPQRRRSSSAAATGRWRHGYGVGAIHTSVERLLAVRDGARDAVLLLGERVVVAFAASEPSSFVVKIRRRLPDFARSVNLKYVRLGLRSGGIPMPSSWVPLALGPLLLAAAVQLLVGADRLYSLDLLMTYAAWLGAAALLLTVYFLKRPRPVYLVEFACYQPGDEHSISEEGFLEMTESTGCFNAEALEFQTKITRRSGLGNRSAAFASSAPCSF